MLEEKLLKKIELPEQTQSLDWDNIWNTLHRRRKLILTSAVIIFSLTTMWMLILPDIYTAETSILVEKVDEKPLNFKEILSPTGESGPAYYETRVALLKSRPILEQTINELNLLPYYQKNNRHVKTKMDAVKLLRGRMSANVLGRTQLLKLAVKDTNPEMAAKIADSLSENFVRETWRERLFISDQLLKWFPGEAKTLEKNAPLQQLKKLDKDDVVGALPSVMQDPVLNGIKQDRMKVDAEIRELSRRYTDQHPKMKELLARAEYLESEFKQQVEKIVSSLKAGLAGEFNINTIKIIESATVPTRPSGPKRLLNIFVATFLTLILAGWSALVQDYLNQNIRSEEDVRKIPLPFLGYLPYISNFEEQNKNGQAPSILDAIRADSRLIDEVINIRTSVLFSMPAERGKLMLCTSSIPGEGKTTIAALVGISIAESGTKVLLVDADMRSPSVHKLFGVPNENGLSSCLAGVARPQEVVQKIEKIPGLDIITAGKRPPNPAILIGSSAMQAFIQQVAPQYDKIIFDTPPALHIADALLLAESMHGAILVFKSEEIHQSVARRLIEKVTFARGILIGGVINQAEFTKIDSHYYQHYHRYAKYYHRPPTAPVLSESLVTGSLPRSEQ